MTKTLKYKENMKIKSNSNYYQKKSLWKQNITVLNVNIALVVK